MAGTGRVPSSAAIALRAVAVVGGDRSCNHSDRSARRSSRICFVCGAARGDRRPRPRGPAAVFRHRFSSRTRVAVEGKHGFAAVLSSYRYAFLGSFRSNFTRVLSAAVIVGLAGMLVNWLSRLPFRGALRPVSRGPDAGASGPSDDLCDPAVRSRRSSSGRSYSRSGMRLPIIPTGSAKWGYESQKGA